MCPLDYRVERVRQARTPRATSGRVSPRETLGRVTSCHVSTCIAASTSSSARSVGTDMLRRMRLRLLTVAMLLACGGGDNTADGGLDAAVDTTTSDTGGSDTGNAESGSESGVEAGPPSCKSSDAGCATCCFTRYADAAAYFFQTEMGCACNVPGDCSTICQNDLCMGAKAGTAC